MTRTPRKTANDKARIRLCLTPSAHRKLAAAAKKAGVSVSVFAASILEAL